MPETASLSFHNARLLVTDWPTEVPLPHGLSRRRDGVVEGPAMLRRTARRTLNEAAVPIVDRTAPLPVQLPAPPPFDAVLASMHATWALTGEGTAIAVPLPMRAKWVHLAAATLSVPALVVVPDTGALSAWSRALLPALGDCMGEHGRGPFRPVTIATAASASWDIGWLGRRPELLVVDGLDLLPMQQLSACVDGCAALLRLGFAAAATGHDLLQRSRGLGPVLSVLDTGGPQRTVELRTALADLERRDYDTAWHEFFAAFDQFASLRPGIGFSEFVRWARTDKAGRPGLLAWHRAARIANFPTGKRRALATLLTRHREQAVLVFTGDRDTAYKIAYEHLVAPVTAELPREERDRNLRGFCAGTLRALVGPRLLDTGVDDGSADVAIFVGPSSSRAQRAARLSRVRRDGTVYELLSQGTLEVGRASRLRGPQSAVPLRAAR